MSALSRYRDLPRNQRILWVVGVVGILAGIGLAIWFGLAASTGKPVWGNLTYQVRDDRHTVVTYQLTRPVESSVVCTVVAKDINHATVGLREDEIPAGGESRLVRNAEVRTTSRAVMGEVRQCRAR